ncbi:unnamed protein product [Adineta steineri]|uniref:Protein kinase domain-containing protein n=1 Tax=Adineta steineri TaxID=433720 RepID=A0A813WXQ3_9BILA|nr:unnamed protein product [Adineta steineri]CAF1355155.1 unnamed protein product [Adineta steineri]CAF1432681.1 unnamed protein product [Adineta steineri]
MVRRLGGGAFGSVWSATTSRGHSAAVKAIDISGRSGNQFDATTLMESFEKEIKMAYRMRKETRHVVTIFGFDFDMAKGLALMAMELGGDTLTVRIEKLHAMKDMQRLNLDTAEMTPVTDYISPRDRKNIWIQLANIVQILHRHHIVHRDMKPDNLVFFGHIMKIVDLGIAQKVVRGSDANGSGIGTPYFSAPECFTTGAQISPKADIWSAGAILYNMTYGDVPKEESSRPPNGQRPTHSRHVADVLHRTLQYEAHQRATHAWLARHPYTSSPSAL